VRATVVNSRIERNKSGLFAYGPGGVEVNARDAVAAGNRNHGFAARTSAARMQLQACVSTNQPVGVAATIGARVTLEGCARTSPNTGVYVADNGVARLPGATIDDNAVGVMNATPFNPPGGNYGHVYTFGNNRAFDNTQETQGKASLVAQQF
jgi:hypothetical protein